MTLASDYSRGVTLALTQPNFCQVSKSKLLTQITSHFFYSQGADTELKVLYGTSRKS
jgi:hypothetical protein